MQKLYEFFKVLPFQKRIYEEIRYIKVTSTNTSRIIQVLQTGYDGEI
jgi:hypothetical protein